MRLKMDLDYLRTCSVYAMTPAYGDMVTAQHHLAMLSLSHLLNQYGTTIHISTHPDSLVTRARNRMAWKFLQGNYTHLLSIDSDIHFFGGDVVHLLVLSQQYDGILGVPYPKKEINWNRVAEAARRGVDPRDLPAVASNFVWNWGPNPPERLRLDEPTDGLRDLGTGYMLIPRHVFTDMIDKGVAQKYKLMPDEAAVYKTDYMWAFYQDPIDPETGFHLSEDYFLCRNWVKCGGKVWTASWMRSRHIGVHEFVGDIPTAARAGSEV
jgi:hypothetical protein